MICVTIVVFEQEGKGVFIQGLGSCPVEPFEELVWLCGERLCPRVFPCAFMCVALLMSLQRVALVCVVMVPISEPHA